MKKNYKSIYKSLAGDLYFCRIINDYGKFYDIELDPKEENTTMIQVRKKFVTE